MIIKRDICVWIYICMLVISLIQIQCEIVAWNLQYKVLVIRPLYTGYIRSIYVVVYPIFLYILYHTIFNYIYSTLFPFNLFIRAYVLRWGLISQQIFFVLRCLDSLCQTPFSTASASYCLPANISQGLLQRGVARESGVGGWGGAHGGLAER